MIVENFVFPNVSLQSQIWFLVDPELVREPFIAREPILEPMAAVINMWRDPPTPVEITVHHAIIEQLNPKQRMAIQGLQAIIQQGKR